MTSITNRLEYIALVIVTFAFSRLPLTLSRKVAEVLAYFIAKVVHLRRKVTLDNLKYAFPEKSDAELEQIYTSCWRHFVRVGAEIAKLPQFNQEFVERWIDTDNIKVFDEALLEKKGVIFASGHFGNWEWLGGAMSVIGYDMTYVITPQSNPLSDRWLNRMRYSLGVEIIYTKDAVRGVLKALKRNRIIAMLSDQDAHESGVFVPFFNRLASTPRGPAVFHLKTGCPIVFGKTIVDSNGKYKVHLERLEFNNLTGNQEEDEYLIMAKITSRLEDEIRQNPGQWLWLHRRWKSSPP